MNEFYNIFLKYNLPIGRLIAFSKSTYRKSNPDNLVLFNANIIVENYGKIWFGDLDITKDECVLQNVANELKMNLYVLYEHDARFQHENDPIEVYISKAKYIVKYE